MINRLQNSGRMLASIMLGVFGCLPIYALAMTGSIESGSVYAWGDKLSWVNFKPTQGGITITDTALTGYAWSQNAGWINFAPIGSGVTNTTSGQLGGYAWSQNAGWINFSGVSINTAGKFTGTAGTSGSAAGQINFDCANCNVTTDWRPLGSRVADATTRASFTIGGYASAYIPGAVIPPIIAASTSPLILNEGSAGLLTTDTRAGPVVVEVPAAAVNKKMSLSITVSPAPATQINPPIPDGFLLNGAFYDIVVHDANGNEVHSFSPPIRITLPLPANLRNIRRLGVYWYDLSRKTWNKIPDAQFFDDHVTFSVGHLTRFAIFATRSSTTVTTPAIVQGPGGGAVVTGRGVVDISLQQRSIAAHNRRIAKEAAQRSTTTKPQQTESLLMTPSWLAILTAILIALITFIRVRQEDES